MIAINPTQWRHSKLGLTIHLALVRPQVLGGAKLQGTVQHVLGSTAQRLIAQTVGVSDEHHAVVVGVGGGDVVNHLAKLAGLQIGDIDPHISLAVHFLGVLAWALGDDLPRLAFVQVPAVNAGAIGVSRSNTHGAGSARGECELVAGSPRPILDLFDRQFGEILLNNCLDVLGFGLGQREHIALMADVGQGLLVGAGWLAAELGAWLAGGLPLWHEVGLGLRFWRRCGHILIGRGPRWRLAGVGVLIGRGLVFAWLRLCFRFLL